jgi:hypothetical protein
MKIELEADLLPFSIYTPGRNRTALKYQRDKNEFTGVVLMKDGTRFAVCVRVRTYKSLPCVECTLTDWKDVRHS